MVSVIEVDENQREYWDKEISTFNQVHPLNAFGWGKVREIDGWKPKYLIAKREDVVSGAVMLLTKPIPLTGLSIMYAPRGPVLNIRDRETLDALLDRIRIEAKKWHAIFLRIDPNITEKAIRINGKDPFLDGGFTRLDHRWSFWNAPSDVSRIDLTRFSTESDLFQSIKQKGRTSIRKAWKQGVVVKAATEEKELRKFYSIFREFTVEKGFMARGYEYQRALWDEFITRGYGKLFLAFHNGEIIGGAIRLLFGSKCLAMHRAVPYAYHHLRVNDALTWEGIRWAKEKGCKWFSFRAMGNTTAQEKFKEKFGPEKVFLAGYYDLPFHAKLYRLIYTVEYGILPKIWNMLMKFRKLYTNASSFLDLTK